MLLLLQLYWSFMKIGFTSFGGLTMIPLISSEMLSHGWMSAAEISDLVAIAEMTPGPLGLNCATFAGIQAAGIPGAVAANLGVLTPTMTVGALAAVFFERFKSSDLMQRLLTGIRPTCIGMVGGVLVTLSLSNYVKSGIVSPVSVLLGIADVLLMVKCKLSIPLTICISAAAGVLLFGVLGL